MKQGIIIVTNNKSKEQLLNCLSSIVGTLYPVLIYTNDYDNSGFESAAITYAYEHTDWDEFVLLQDTVEVKNIDFFNIVFEEFKGKTVFAQNGGFSFLNKYTRKALLLTGIPKTKTKRESIYAESTFHRALLNTGVFVLWPKSLKDNPNREFKFGRKNMILENDYIKKYKGCWNINMVKADGKS